MLKQVTRVVRRVTQAQAAYRASQDVMDRCEVVGLDCIEEDTTYQPLFGEGCKERTTGSVSEYVNWFYDGEDARYEGN